MPFFVLMSNYNISECLQEQAKKIQTTNFLGFRSTFELQWVWVNNKIKKKKNYEVIFVVANIQLQNKH